MDEAYISALFGLLGTFIGAGITWLTTDKSARLKQTFDLHREFNDDLMNKNRNMAYRLLLKYPNMSFKDLSETLPPEETNPLWVVISFYERLWLGIKHNQIQTKLVPDLFGNLFIWWYYFSFEKQLVVLDWKSAEDVKQLMIWLKDKVTEEVFDEWKNKALKVQLNAKA